MKLLDKNSDHLTIKCIFFQTKCCIGLFEKKYFLWATSMTSKNKPENQPEDALARI